MPRAPVLADAAYGTDTRFREALTKLDLPYVVGILSSVSVWAPGKGPLPKRASKTTGRPSKLLRRDCDHQPGSVKELAFSLPATVWQTVPWRQGTKRPLRSRFAALRVRPAHRDYWRSEPHPEQWLLIEWPKGEAEPTQYWLSTMPASLALRELVRLGKQRWIIERDYEELKQELGLGHFEGRGWRGFHHHATLCIAAYGFLVRGTQPFFPLRARQTPGVTRRHASARLPTPRFAACGPGGIILIPSLLCASASPASCGRAFPVAPFAVRYVYNTVVLENTFAADCIHDLVLEAQAENRRFDRIGVHHGSSLKSWPLQVGIPWQTFEMG